MNMSIKQKTWSKLSSLTSLNLDQVLIPSQNTCLSSCMVTWLSHDITLPPRHGWLHSSSRLLAWSDFVPGDLIRCQVVPLVITVAGGERRSAYSWRASLSALHTLGEGEVVQSTRQGYSWRTSFQTGFSTFPGGACFSDLNNVVIAFRTEAISANRGLGSGHFPLSRSSSTCLRTTSWHLCRSDITAILVIPPSSPLDLLMKENWRRVSKQVLANSSRSFLLESVSMNESEDVEWMEPLLRSFMICLTKSAGIVEE